MKITTNNRLRPLTTWHELPAGEQSIYDYVEGDDRWTPRFVNAYGSWWDTHDFERIRPASQEPYPSAAFTAPDGSPLLQWDGICTTSHFTATVVRYDFDEYPDGDHAVIGWVAL